MDPYIGISDATTYFDERLHSEVWYASEPNDQLAALKTATRYIDRLNFAGEKTDSTQERQFPRDDDTTVPQDILDACCEVALALLDGVDIEVERNNLDMTRQDFGNAKSTYDRSMKPAHILAGIPSIVAWNLLLPYLRDPRTISVNRV